MKYIIWPIALFIAEYFSFGFPVYYGLRIQIYVYLFFILMSIYFLKFKVPRDIINNKILLFVTVFLVFQLFSMLISASRIDNMDYYRNPYKTYILFCGFILSIYIHYLVVRLNINSISDIKAFLVGGKFALILSLSISLLQLLYIILPAQFVNVVELIGSTIEARWGGKNADDINLTGYYSLGSYVQTTLRINGLTEEAPSLVTQFFIIFVPFLLASVKNKYNVFSKKTSNILPIYTALLLIIIIMIAAKTTSGFLFGAIIILFFLKNISLKKKLIVISLAFLSLLIIVGYNVKNNYLLQIINEFIVNKSENSVNNRLGISIAQLKITIQNFITGIGWEFHPYFIYENIPDWARHNSEYFSYLKRKDFPIMNVFLSWTAEYGVVFVTLVIIFLVRMQREFQKLSSKLAKDNDTESSLIRVLCDSSKYYLFFTLISSLLLYVWYTSVYLIVFFFFISVIRVLKNYYRNL